MAADPNKLKVAKELSRKEILFGVARQPGGERLFLGASTARVLDVDLAAEKPEAAEWEAHRGYVTSVTLAGEQVVSGAFDGKLIWWKPETGEQVRSIDAHRKWVRKLRTSPDGKHVVSVADDMVCRVWNAESGELVRELVGHEPMTPHHFPSMLFTCEFSPDGVHLATADKTGRILVWEFASGKQVKELKAPLMYTWDPKQRIHSIGGIRSLAFSPDGNSLACGGIGQIGNIDHLGALARMEIFDWRKGERTFEFPGETYKGLVQRIAYHPDGKWMVIAGGDHNGFIQIIDLETKKVIKHAKAPMHVHDFVVDESLEKIYAAGHGKVVVWTLTE
ncbi:MAG: hypothetical protein QGG36_31740 [Pirellulaceae bacterium]|jgi:WD40 repeat protein|nr:hypothetical protein [Pirellulaceae bacterium]